MIEELNLKFSLKILLFIITLGYVVAIVMLLMFFDNIGNQSKTFHNIDSHITSDSKQLHSDTKRHDNNSKQGKVNNQNTHKVINPVDDKRGKKIEHEKPVIKPADPGMNATHIKGILMESIYVNYTRNIYFSVKTTYKNFDRRLFPLMLTWLQLVDKNKVRLCRLYI